MHWRYVLIGLVVVGLAAPASGEFYRYTDENGVLRYTDTYMDIPIEQRRGVTPLIETEAESIPAPAVETEPAENALRAKNPAGTPAAGLLEMHTMLTQKKQQLDHSYAQLLKERQMLEKEEEAVSMSDPDQAEAYRDKVIDFNRRLKAHRQQVETFAQQVEAFNKQGTVETTEK